MKTASRDAYRVRTGRNLGLVSPAEQESLRSASAFICGVGGMGGAVFETLLRAGVGQLSITDPDHFDASNLNRQLLATRATLGGSKVAAAVERAAGVAPDATVHTWGDDWVRRLDEILPAQDVVVNGMDDVRAAIQLYRRAREHDVVVVDAYTSPLASVTRVAGSDPRPEERLGFPSEGRDPSDLSDDDVTQCLLREIEYVAAHSTALDRIDASVARDVLAGRRPRPSFAPLVLLNASLLATEAIAVLLGHETATDHRGWFLDPASGRVERPRTGPAAWFAEGAARRSLHALVDRGGR